MLRLCVHSSPSPLRHLRPRSSRRLRHSVRQSLDWLLFSRRNLRRLASTSASLYVSICVPLRLRLRLMRLALRSIRLPCVACITLCVTPGPAPLCVACVTGLRITLILNPKAREFLPIHVCVQTYVSLRHALRYSAPVCVLTCVKSRLASPCAVFTLPRVVQRRSW